MRRRRWLLALSLWLAAAGVLAGTLAYGLYYRSERYRLRVEHALTAFFGLPTDLQAIGPDTTHSRVLTNIQMWLPERRARIFSCPRAVWDASGRQGGGTTLHLYDSVVSIGSKEWKSDDYMAVLKASLLHNFSELDIREVRFHNGRLAWPRQDFQMLADGLDGTVVFDGSGKGEAVLTSQSLNGTHVAEPIRIHASIDPASPDDFLPEVSLTVPPLPLPTLGLDNVLGTPVTQGSFAGKITLRQSREADTIELQGLASDVRIEEFTSKMQGGPLHGLVDLTIHRASIRGRELEHLRFSGNVHDLSVDPLLRRFGLPAIGGKIHVQVDNGRLEGESIAGLSMAGTWRGGSLAGLSQLLLGSESVAGNLDVRINSLVIRDDQLASGNIDIEATPPTDKPGTIDRALLLSLLQKYLGLQLPAMIANMLPDSVEFVQARAKLLIDGTKLQILTIPNGTDKGGAILTVRMAGQELPLVRQIDHVFDLQPMVDRARRQAHEWKGTLDRRRGATRPN